MIALSQQTKSQADLLRDWINKKLDQKFDFSKSSEVTADIQHFCNAHPNLKQNVKKLRPSYDRILKECAKNRNLELEHLGKKTKRLKFNKKLQAKIEPHPVGKVTQTQTQTSTTGTQTPPVVLDKDGKPIPQPEIHNWQNFDEESVGAAWGAFYSMFGIAYPELKPLSDSKQKSLGKIWLPAFQRYLTENWAILGVPFIATIGLLLPDILEARRLHKQNKGVESKPENIKAAEKEKQEKEELDDIKCDWCGQKANTWTDLKFHKRSCKKKPKAVTPV